MHLSGEGIGGKRLLKEAPTALHQPPADHVFIRVSGHEDDRQARTDFRYPAGQVPLQFKAP